MPWICPTCGGRFARRNQRHACAARMREDVLRGRSPELVQLYAALERFVVALGPVEVVARERYVLFRSLRIFADLGVQTQSLRLAIHLGRRIEHPLIEKTAADARQVSHIVRLREPDDLAVVEPWLAEAYVWSLQPRRTVP